ncbi:translation elongation factor EF-1 subunit alpha [Candidatus Thorarchaeota archaeon]|nr:MAG: translation elongation factor EF-1 subunit alpha [Candidatus Thorarchaeota archaeon]
MSNKDKEHLNLVVIGHVDHGKSTMTGRLLYETGAVDERTFQAHKAEAEKLGRPSWAWAFALDRLKEERERGLTIDIAFFKFLTDKFYYTIIDAPGHKDFIKNMITGASQADVALLVVSAKKGEFEAGIGPGGQTKEHAYLAKTLGVDNLIVCINKMDDESVDYSEDRYKEVKEEVMGFLKNIGFKTDQVEFIPTSALSAANLKERTPDLTPWYEGISLLEALDTIELPPKPIDKPLRIPINDVYSIKGVGTVPVGRVETGVLKPGMKVTFMPPNKTGEVKTVEMHHEMLDQAVPGDNIGFNVRGVERKDLGRGDVAGPTDKPPTVAADYTGQIMVIQHPTAITVGYTPVIHAHTAQIACRFDELLQKLDQRTGQVTQENPDFVKRGESMIAKLVPLKPMVIEPYKELPQLGRFAVRDMGMTVAVGVVTKVTPREPGKK